MQNLLQKVVFIVILDKSMTYFFRNALNRPHKKMKKLPEFSLFFIIGIEKTVHL